MEDYITKNCIIEEYLNNWFTYDELAEYLCIDKKEVIDVLDHYCTLDDKLNKKVTKHRRNIQKYYDTIDDNVPIILHSKTTEDKYPVVDVLNVNQSFFAPVSFSENKAAYNRLHYEIYKVRKRTNKEFVTDSRVENGVSGVRVWRIK